MEVIKGELTLDGTTRVTRIKKEDNSCPSFAYPYNLRNRGDPSSGEYRRKKILRRFGMLMHINVFLFCQLA